MKLTKLRLKCFRNYGQISLMPPPGVTVLTGRNGSGKTNLLEAMHLCCLGRSHRTSTDRDMIMTGEDSAAVELIASGAGGSSDVGIRLYTQARKRKLIYLNGKTVPRIGDLMGHVRCVMFSPEDLSLIKGAPQERRQYLNMLLSQLRPAYFTLLQRYASALASRNALLRAAQGHADARQLDVWDEQLCALAVPIYEHRRQLCNRLQSSAQAAYRDISGSTEERLQVRYISQPGDASDLGARVAELLTARRELDTLRGATSVGPHRDDLELTLVGHDIKAFASQGQMRTAALALRLAQLEAMHQEDGETPLLLLDDVLSELDVKRRERLLQRLSGIQTFITCTDESDLGGARADARLRIQEGTIQ